MTNSHDTTSPVAKACLQCGATTTLRYCAGCGQDTRVGPLRVRGIASDIFRVVIDLELPILHTTRGLLLAPGLTAARWIDGQRKAYTNPIKYCVIVGIAYALLISMRLSEGAAFSPAGQEKLMYSLSKLAQQYVAFLLMLLALPFALVAGALSRLLKVSRTATEWYVLFLYCLGISLLLQMLASMISVIVASYASLLPLIFLLWGSWQFAGREARWRSLAVAVLAMIAWVSFFQALNSLR